MTEDASAATARSSTVQSVTRAVALLRCFEDAGPELTLTDLARATGLTLSTAHRLAATLVDGGMLHRDPGDEHYRLGPALVGLARAAVGPANAERATALVEDLVRRTGESASLGISDGRTVVVLVGVESPQPLRFDRPPGTQIPVHVSAMGKAMLAFGAEPAATVAKSLAPLARFTPRTLTSQRALASDLEATRIRGWALVDEEQVTGVRSLAVPVLGEDGFAVAAVGVQGPVGRLVDAALPDLVAAVRDTARATEILTRRGYLR